MGALDKIKQAQQAARQRPQQEAILNEAIRWRMLRQASAELIQYSTPFLLLSALFREDSSALFYLLFGLIFLTVLQPTAYNIANDTQVSWRFTIVTLMSSWWGPWFVGGFWFMNFVTGQHIRLSNLFSMSHVVTAVAMAGIAGLAWWKLRYGAKTKALQVATGVA